MPVVFANFVVGTVMDAAAVQANYALGYTYLNGGIVNGDLDSPCVEECHVFRPEILGWPTEGFMGQMQDVYGQDTPDGIGFAFGDDSGFMTLYGGKRNRFDILLASLDADTFAPIHRMCKTIWVPGTMSTVDLSCQWSAEAIQGSVDNDQAGLKYPAYAGRFILRYKAHATRTWTEIAESERQMQVKYDVGGVYANQARWRVTQGRFDTNGVAGLWDVGLFYDADGVLPSYLGVLQVIVGSRNFKVEVHRSQQVDV